MSECVSGFAHGAVVGSGVDVASGDFTKLLRFALVGGAVGAAKDMALYIQQNPMPNIFAPPQIAPTAAPVSPPTLGDPPKETKISQ